LDNLIDEFNYYKTNPFENKNVEQMNASNVTKENNEKSSLIFWKLPFA